MKAVSVSRFIYCSGATDGGIGSVEGWIWSRWWWGDAVCRNGRNFDVFEVAEKVFSQELGGLLEICCLDVGVGKVLLPLLCVVRPCSTKLSAQQSSFIPQLAQRGGCAWNLLSLKGSSTFAIGDKCGR